MISLTGLDKEIENQISNIPAPTGEKKPFVVEQEPTQESTPEPTPPDQEINLETIEEKPSVLKDSKGNEFDLRIHEKNKDGTPRIWKGKLKLKKGWHKAWEQIELERAQEKEKNFEPIEPEPIPESLKQEPTPLEQVVPEAKIPGVSDQDLNGESLVDAPPGLMDISNRYIAELITDAYINIGVMKFGDEWHPIQISKNGKTDRDDIVLAWEKYLDEKRAGEKIPAWLAPFLTMGSYAVTRITTKKKTQEGFFNLMGKAKHWFWTRLAWFKGRFFGKKNEDSKVSDEK